MSNDSLQTLDKAVLNANLNGDPSEASIMNTVPHNEGSRMLEELYNNQEPFPGNESEVSYHNSREVDD